MCGYENAKSAVWSVTLIILLVIGGLPTGRADAADQARPIQIGTLNPSWGPVPSEVGLRDGLQELGYRENKDFVLGIRFTQGDTTALPAAARELIQFGADIIFASTQSAAKAAQRATTRLPVVFAIVSDPLGSGLVESFARPGGNVTGVADLSIELGPKRLEVFRQIIPNLKRVFSFMLQPTPLRWKRRGYTVVQPTTLGSSWWRRRCGQRRKRRRSSPRFGKRRWMESWGRINHI